MAKFIIAAETLRPDKANTLYYRALADDLIGRGHRVLLLAAQQGPSDARGNPAFLSWPSGSPKTPRDARFFYDLVRRYRPECVISQFGAVNLCTLVGALARVPTRIVWYRTITQSYLDDGIGGWWRRLRWLRKRLVFAAATHVIANSRASAADAQAVFGVAPQRTLVLYNLVPDPGLDGAPKDACRLISVGRFTPSKNQRVLLEALPGLVERFPGLRMDFFGDGPLKGACERLAAELGVAEHCTFHGYAPLPVVMPALARAAVCVVTSHSEALGYVGIEAQAVGTPVVASGVDGIREVVADGETGFLVPPAEPAAFTEKIALLLSDRDLRERFGRAARQRFLEIFSTRNIPAHAEALERLVLAQRA